MHFAMIECVGCKFPVEVRLLGLWSGLGPPVFFCGKCGHPNDVGRREWADFRLRNYLRFVLVSLIALSGLALLGGIVGGISYPVEGVSWADREIDANPGFIVGSVAFAAFGVALQVYRVISSLGRTAVGSTPSFRQSWWELQTNVQMKVCLCALALGILGGCVSCLMSA